MMRALGLVVPSLTVLAVIVLAAVPWGSPPQLKLVLPVLPYVLIHLWSEHRPEALPEWATFLLGLTSDVLGQGPLGFWALIFLSGQWIALTSSRLLLPAARIPVFMLTAALLAVLQWMVGSLYGLRLLEVEPLAIAAVAASAIYAGLVLIFPGGEAHAARSNERLQRGA